MLSGADGSAMPVERRLQLLTAAAATLFGTLRLHEVVPRALDLAREALAADAYALWRVDRARGEWKVLAQAGLSERYIRESIPRLAGDLVLPRQPMVFEDPDAAPMLAGHRGVQREEGIQSLLGIPLILHGEPGGTLVFYYRQPRRFSASEIDAATLAGSLAAGAIMNAELYDASMRDAARYHFLADNAHDVVARVSPDGVYRDVSPAVARVFGYAPEELVGTLAREKLHPDDLARIRAMGRDRLEDGLQILRYRHKDGHWVTTETAVRVLRAPDGSVEEFVASMRDISQRKAFERDLGLHTRVLGSMMEGVCLSTADGTLVYTNPAQDRMFGYERGELIGEPFAVLSARPPDEAADFLREVAARLSEQGHWEGELENVRKDGARFTTHARFTSFEIDGEAHWVCVQEDLTQARTLLAREQAHARTLKTLMRVQMELASNLELERIVQTATDAATSLTGASFGAFFYNVTDANGDKFTLYTLSGAPREAFSKFPHPRATDLFGPTFRGEGVVRVDDVLQDPRYGRSAPYHGMPHGHLPVRSYLAVPVIGRDGTVHGGLFFGHPEPGRFTADDEEAAVGVAAQTAVALDNAHLYRRARENEERLLESERRFRTLISATTQMVWVADKTGQISDLPEWRAFTGQTQEEIRDDGWADAIHPEDRERVLETWQRAYESRALYECEYRVRSKTGEYRHFLARGVPRHGSDGELIEYIGTWTDVSEQKHLLQEAEALRAQLIQGEKLAALGQLVSGVAHELRTPLTFLNTNAFLARQRVERGAKRGASAGEILRDVAPYLDEVMAGVERINALVSDLRRYTRSRREGEFRAVSLDAVARDAVELFRAANRGTHVLHTRLDATRPVSANVGAVQQLLLNLLQNAADASPPGRPVRVRTRDDGDDVVLEVQDEGRGIPVDVQERMFEPLFTTKPQGTGLGLSIVRRIVDEHHARIEVNAAPGGEGTTFRVRFPAA